MSEIWLSISCTVEPEPHETRADLERHFEAVADEFHDDRGLSDQSISYNAPSGRMVFELILDAEDPLDAAQKGYAHVRSAIHAAGGATPGWEQRVRDLSLVFESQKDDQSESEPACV